MQTDATQDEVERLSAELHAIYQEEARRQAGVGEDTVRHPDDYASLAEHTKEYDRVLARYILRREAADHNRVAELEQLVDELTGDCSHSWRSIAYPGVERQSGERPAWCSVCGSLRSEKDHKAVRQIAADARAQALRGGKQA